VLTRAAPPPSFRPVPARPLSRRTFHQLLAGAAVGLGTARWSPLRGAPAVVVSGRPQLPSGVMAGDVTAAGAVLWSRCDRAADMVVEVATMESFRGARTFRGPAADPARDGVAKLALAGLPAGERIFYRVRFEDLADRRRVSEPVVGSFRTVPAAPRDVRFVWSGDTAGQGWGIDPARGGMLTYAAMRAARPDFFVHSGDTIYADNPLAAEVKLPDGTLWKNLLAPGKTKVAETAAEFRGAHLYNLLDEHVRRFAAEVPVFAQWDDHEVVNNWYPGEILDDPRYTEKNVDVLAARAREAFFDCLPIRGQANDSIHRVIPYGPDLELFFLDLRTYRAANSANDQPVAGADTAFLGRAQLEELERRLIASRATWKIICSDMPLGLIVRDGPKHFEGLANDDAGAARGRELELASLLRTLHRAKVRNLVWLTADVHYAASHHYSPDRAQFRDFDPFWEFVSGPLHAGTFGPNKLDATFGPEVRFTSLPPNFKGGGGPAAGLQFFGSVHLDAATKALTVSHHNSAGANLWSVTLDPAKS
jgi:alkaline phosphatase D